MSLEDDAVAALARALEVRGAGGAEIALVLGSGLGGFTERLENPLAIPFEDLEGMPRSAVAGHAGRIVVGRFGGARVLVQQGRAHLYEGFSALDVTRSVRAFARIGCRALCSTNAAGGLRKDWSPPTLMRIVDHVNLQGVTPLAMGESGGRDLYDAAIGEALDLGAREAGLALERGRYAGVLGPSYETPAEIRMIAWLGGDAVGMSTVCETQAARAAGMRVAAVSCITNHAAGISPRPLSHAEVLEASGTAVDRLARILERAVPRILALLASGR